VLSHAQATEVAKRFNPSAGRTLWFADDGSLLSGAETHRAVAGLKGEIYACRRPAAGGAVEVARVTEADLEAGLEAGVEPRFGEPW
jgi:hypothetical protein